ncbi:MAG: Asp-tRNA(Asn)/Glu-tRNA(Gln) amidotransferase subunit GatC [bacterium]
MDSNNHSEKVERLARLAYLDIQKEEVMILEKQLEDTLSYVSHLNEIETDGVSPTSQVSGNINVFRNDEIKQSFTQEEALSNAKRKYKGYFATNAVL